MAWTTPRTWVTDEVPTAATLNTHIRDNLNALAALGFVGAISAGSVGTSSSTAVMMGMGAQAFVAPVATGRVVVVFVLDSTCTGANTYFIEARRGTGAAPAGGDPVTGTSISQEYRIVPSAGGLYIPSTVIGYSTGLVVGTTYWFDLALRSSGLATTLLENITMIVCEV